MGIVRDFLETRGVRWGGRITSFQALVESRTMAPLYVQQLNHPVRECLKKPLFRPMTLGRLSRRTSPPASRKAAGSLIPTESELMGQYSNFASLATQPTST